MTAHTQPPTYISIMNTWLALVRFSPVPAACRDINMTVQSERDLNSSIASVRSSTRMLPSIRVWRKPSCSRGTSMRSSMPVHWE